MKSFFITASGTGIGKTLITCALASQLRAKGHEVLALKPVISGFDPADWASSDSGQLLAAQGLPFTRENLEAISPWRFAAPLSPDMAAADEKKAIDTVELVRFCQRSTGKGYLLIEGVGGVMAPLRDRFTVLDWMQALGLPVILVGGSYLGSLSHTLSACEALSARGIALHAVIASESENQPVPLARTVDTLKRQLPDNVTLATVGRLDSARELWKTVPDITSLVL